MEFVTVGRETIGIKETEPSKTCFGTFKFGKTYCAVVNNDDERDVHVFMTHETAAEHLARIPPGKRGQYSLNEVVLSRTNP